MNNNDLPDEELNRTLQSYVKDLHIDPSSLERIESGVFASLASDEDVMASTPESPLDWLMQVWWRPVMASVLPLIFGFTIGLNSQHPDDADPADITSMVYLQNLDELTDGAISDEF